MGAVDTTYTFTATDTITSTKMNNIIDQTTMTSDAIIGNTLEVASGKLKVRAQGITSNEMATGSVTSNAILDGTIVNADINASAAINGTKISPNFGSQNITTTGTLSAGIGSVISGSSSATGLRITQTGSGHSLIVEDEANPDSTPFIISSSGTVCVGSDQTYGSYLPGFTTNYSAKIQGVGPSYQEGPWMSLSQYSTSTTDSGGSFISLNKSNNSTIGSHTIVTNNQKIGEIGWAGSNGTTFSGIAGISANVDGSPTSTSVSGRLIFSTTGVGGNLPAERMRIDNAGNVGIGKTPTTKLDVNGTVTATAFDGPLTGNVTGNVTGNATTATTLQTARTIAISGDVTGTATSFNGSSNISIPVTIDNDSVTTAKIANSTSTTTGVTTAKIADNAITTVKVLNANITPEKLSQPSTLATALASTSGTSINFTSIPSWVKRITVMFSAVSTSGSSNLLIQIGDSGGIETTGYKSVASDFNGSTEANTIGFILDRVHTASAIFNGSIVLSLVTGNSFVSNGILAHSDDPTYDARTASSAGSKTLSAAINRVRITTVNGTDTFDAGSINIMYE